MVEAEGETAMSEIPCEWRRPVQEIDLGHGVLRVGWPVCLLEARGILVEIRQRRYLDGPPSLRAWQWRALVDWSDPGEDPDVLPIDAHILRPLDVVSQLALLDEEGS